MYQKWISSLKVSNTSRALIRDDSGNVVDYEGYNVFLLAEIQSQMGFTVEDVTPTLAHWGRLADNGTWYYIRCLSLCRAKSHCFPQTVKVWHMWDVG